jgi:hypothetical protein
MATDSKLKMRLALEPREIAAVIVACNEMLQMAQSGRTFAAPGTLRMGLKPIWSVSSPRLISAGIHERAA